MSAPKLCVAPRYVSPPPPLSPHFLNNLLKRKNLGENEIIRLNQEEKEVVLMFFLLCLFIARCMCTLTQEFFCGFFVVIVYWKTNTLQHKRNYIFSNFFSYAY